MDYSNFQLTTFDFPIESSWPLDLIGPSALSCPVKIKGSKETAPNPPIDTLGKAIGFNEPQITALLSHHSQRMKLRKKIIIWPYIVIAVLSIIANAWFTLSHVRFVYAPLTSIPLASLAFSFTAPTLFIIVLYFIGFSLAIVSIRLITIFVDKYFAESLCITSALYVVLSLSRDDVLFHPHRRRDLQRRLQSLARSTVLLSLRYPSQNQETQEWITKHFKHIERYIRERERWLVAPTETTLADLRRDFYTLTSLFITGNYGSFTWDDMVAIQSPPQTRRQRIIHAMARLINVLLPLTGLGVLVLQPHWLQGVNTSGIGLFLLAWLAFAIDSLLNLGIVAHIIALAKGIKELR